jgi:hypothetical protein
MMLVTVSLIKVKLCCALLHMLLVCNCSYLKWVLRYTFLFWIIIFQTHYIYTSKTVRICGYFSKPEGVCEQNSGKHWLRWLTRRLITEVECEFMIFYVCYFKTLSVAKLYSILICVRISDEVTLSGLKTVPAQTCPPPIHHRLVRDWAQTYVVRDQWLLLPWRSSLMLWTGSGSCAVTYCLLCLLCIAGWNPQSHCHFAWQRWVSQNLWVSSLSHMITAAT